MRLLSDVPWRAKDLSSERAFEADYWDERSRTAARAAERAAFVLEHKGRWIGIVETMATEDPAASEIHGFWVDPAWRRRGHGRDLLLAAAAWAIEGGYQRLVSRVWEQNTPALAVHLGAGFRRTGGVVRWPDHSNWQVDMVRDLP